MKRLLLSWLLLLLLAGGRLGAQQFPVTATASIVRAGPVLEGYGQGGDVIVTFTLNDNRSEYVGYPEITISGNGYEYRSTDRTPVRLTRGQPLILRGNRLARYLGLGVMQGSGLDNGGRLPEGPVRVTAAFFDAVRDDLPAVSNTAVATRFARQDYPPVIIRPVGEIRADPVVLLQWSPRHVPEPANDRYRPEVFEWPEGLTEDQVINFQPNILPRDLVVRGYTYALQEVTARLVPGTRYLWRVQLFDAADLRRFRNNGFSRHRSFTYGEGTDGPTDCAPVPVNARFATADGAEVHWDLPATPPRGYELAYRAAGERSWVAVAQPPPADSTYRLTGLAADQDYELQLCVNCADGGRSCSTTGFRTLTDLEDCGPLILPTVVGLSPTTARVDWDSLPRARGFILRWGTETVSEGPREERRAAPELGDERPGREGAASDRRTPTAGRRELRLPAGSTTATLDGLVAGRRYEMMFCKLCPDGSEECYSWSYVFGGAEDDCLDDFVVVRTDSSETGLTLNWTLPAANPAADSIELRWEPVSQSEPARSVRLPYASGGFTIEGLTPEVTYRLELCGSCVAGLPVCRDLGDFGGCRSAYTPELTDLSRNRALLSWPVATGEAVRTTRLRYRRRAFPGWRDQPVGELTSFRAEDYGLTPQQAAEIGPLRQRLVYVAEIQTLCGDSTWSEYSEPVAFSLDCATSDSLFATAVADTTATLNSRPYPAARAYRFEYRVAGSADWIGLPETTGPEVDLSALLPATDYEARMRFRCRYDLLSDYTPILRFRTEPPCGLPTEQRVDSLSYDFAALGWTPAEFAVTTELRFRRVLPRSGMVRPWRTVTGLGEGHALDQLRNGQTYEYSLQSVCRNIRGARTQVQQFTLECAPPDRLTVGSPTPHTAPVTLRGLPNGGGRPTVEYRIEGTDAWLTAAVDDSTTLLTDLSDLTWYEARAYTDCRGGQTSPPTEIVRFQTPVDCRVPDSLLVTDATQTTATLRWPVTGTVDEWEVRYQLRYVTATGNGVQQVQNVATDDQVMMDGDDGAASSGTAPASPPSPYANWTSVLTQDPTVLLTQLTAHGVYRVVVRASCPTFGWTEFSAPVELTTLCPAEPPAELVAAEIRRRELLVSWSASRCAEEYLVSLESLFPLNTDPGTATPNAPGMMDRGPYSSAIPPEIYRDSLRTSDRSVRFTGLRGNTEYRVRIKALARDFSFVAGPPHGLEPAWTDYGEWFTFRTDDCGRPRNVTDEQVGRSEFLISWDPSNGRNDYLLEYKLRDDPTAGWQEVRTPESSVRINDVLRGEIYDYKVTEVCIDGDQLTSRPDSFLVERVSLGNGLYICGINTDVDLSNQVPLSVLEKDDTIMAFDFKMVITEASGGNGRFTGKGELRVPYFNMAKMTFDFDNIFVNDEYRMVDGYMGATGFGVEVLPPWADSLLAAVMMGLQYLDAQAQEEQLQTLDSLMLCCADRFPPWLRTEIQAVLDCYAAAEALADQQGADQPDDAHCDALLDSLMTHVLGDLDSISDQIGEEIVESRAADLIRLALEELDSLYTPGYGATAAAYTSARSAVDNNYPPPTPGDGGDGAPTGYTIDIKVLEDGPAPAGAGPAGAGQYRDRALELRARAIRRVIEDIYLTAHERLSNHEEIRTFARPLRPGDTDVYGPVLDAVNGGEIDDATIIELAKGLIETKVEWLINN